jgi:succinate-acetate transporter protein
MSRSNQVVFDNGDATSRITYDRFVEFDRVMRMYPSTTYRGANSVPLGLSAFALSLFVLSMYYAGATVVVSGTVSVAMGLALFYGGLIQLIAGLLQFRSGHNLYALFFCSYAGYFLSLAALYISSFGFFTTAATTTPASYSDMTAMNNALGVYYLGWSIFTACLLIASVRTNAVLILLLFFLTVTYTLLTASFFNAGTIGAISSNINTTNWNVQRAAGAFGILTAVIAWFGAFASLLKKGENSYFNLPVYDLVPTSQAGLIDKAPVEVRTQ